MSSVLIYVASLAAAILLYWAWDHQAQLLALLARYSLWFWVGVVRGVAWGLGRERGARFLAGLGRLIEMEADSGKQAFQRMVLDEVRHE